MNNLIYGLFDIKIELIKLEEVSFGCLMVRFCVFIVTVWGSFFS